MHCAHHQHWHHHHSELNSQARTAHIMNRGKVVWRLAWPLRGVCGPPVGRTAVANMLGIPNLRRFGGSVRWTRWLSCWGGSVWLRRVQEDYLGCYGVWDACGCKGLREMASAFVGWEAHAFGVHPYLSAVHSFGIEKLTFQTILLFSFSPDCLIA